MGFEEKRKYTRIIANLAAELTAGKTTHLQGTCKNISAKGIYFECDPQPAENSKVELILYLGDSRYDPSIRVQGIVVRREANGVGLQLTGVDFNDYELLKNIIVYSAEDPDAAEREFKKFLDLYRL